MTTNERAESLKTVNDQNTKIPGLNTKIRCQEKMPNWKVAVVTCKSNLKCAKC